MSQIKELINNKVANEKIPDNTYIHTAFAQAELSKQKIYDSFKREISNLNEEKNKGNYRDAFSHLKLAMKYADMLGKEDSLEGKVNEIMRESYRVLIKKDIECAKSFRESGHIEESNLLLKDADILCEEIKYYPRSIDEIKPTFYDRVTQRITKGKDWKEKVNGKYDAELNILSGVFKKQIQNQRKENKVFLERNQT